MSHNSPLHAVASFSISPVLNPTKKFNVTAVIVPRVTCDLPLHPVLLDTKWEHIIDLLLADPDFGRPGRVEMLLGINLFVQLLRQGRQIGPPGSPSAFETEFGWVLAGRTCIIIPCHLVTTHHVAMVTGDDILRKFWEIEEHPKDSQSLSPDEQFVAQHFKDNHHHYEKGSFVVPLPKKPHAKQLGESRSQAVRRFLSLERSLRAKGQFEAFNAVMDEYFEMGHAELVPAADLEKPPCEVFYLPMPVVRRKESNSTTKIRAVFDASAKSTTGISLNDTLLLGPTVHLPLVDVLLHF